MIGVPEAILLGSAIIAVAMVLSAFILGRYLSAPAGQGYPQQLSSFAPMPPLSAEASPVNPSGVPVDADTRLEIGTAVLADWSGAWWNAEVIELLKDGRVRIHYTGWDSSWDETVPRSRLQMDIRKSVRR